MLVSSEDRQDPHMTLDSFNVAQGSTGTFSATTNARGDFDGTSMPFTLFTVTGDVLVRLYGVCTATLTGSSATISVGVTGNTALILPSTTATGIATGDLWIKTSPAIGDTLANVPGPFVIPNSLNIIETIGTADITGGSIYYVCLWRPLSHGATVVKAF